MTTEYNVQISLQSSNSLYNLTTVLVDYWSYCSVMLAGICNNV